MTEYRVTIAVSGHTIRAIFFNVKVARLEEIVSFAAKLAVDPPGTAEIKIEPEPRFIT